MNRELLREVLPVPLTRVSIDDAFWKPRMVTNRAVTLPYEYKVCKDSGRLDGYQWTWKKRSNRPYTTYWMGDVGKWIEAAAYSLAERPDPRLAADAVDRVIRGQKPNGYLYCAAVKPGTEWANLQDMHELYDAGHLMEAAVAYHEATGDSNLLDAMRRNGDLLTRVFGPKKGQIRGYCGHPEIELALVKLYRATGEKRYLDLARFFVNERGRRPHIFDVQAKQRGEKTHWQPYKQYVAHRPVREMSTAEGHAVRALYLFSGMADVAMETRDKSLLAACKRIWRNIVRRRMYITGGAGSSHHGEAFTFDYDLPNETCYAETCADIALVFFAHRLLQIEPDGEYADVMERALYNAVLSGVGLDGRSFCYTNALTVYPEALKGAAGHAAASRQRWLKCACCPPNIARILASFGQYVYSQAPNEAYVNLYVAGGADLDLDGRKVRLTQKTRYPWEGAVKIAVQPESAAEFALVLRIPGWCRHPQVRINGKLLNLATVTKKGYARLRRRWTPGDVVELAMPMPIERIEANPKVRMDCGKVALQRGPLVYCLEEADNGKNLAGISLPRSAPLKTTYDRSLLGGTVVITGPALRRSPEGWDDALYRPLGSSRLRPFTLKGIPYCLRANRKVGEMVVWFREG